MIDLAIDMIAWCILSFSLVAAGVGLYVAFFQEEEEEVAWGLPCLAIALGALLVLKL